MQQADHFDLVDEATACRILGGDQSPIHRSTLWRGIRAGDFPPPLKIGARSNRWLVSELLAVRVAAARSRQFSAT